MKNIDELVKKYVDGTTFMFRLHQRLRAALTEQAETHAMELRAYEATVQNLEQRIKELEAQRVPEGWKLVPVEPTDAMPDEIKWPDETTYRAMTARHRAMLAAAPAKEDSRHECSSFCVPGEQCAITADGDCDVRAEIAAIIQPEDTHHVK